MQNRRGLKSFALLILTGIAVAACAPPAGSGLPEGPTTIPTLIPVTEQISSLEATEPAAFTVLSYPARPPSASEGQRIYDIHCAECHAEDGTGAFPEARNFKDFDYIRGETPARFYGAVTEGQGDMPGFSDVISSDERWDVVFYVWRLSTSEAIIQAGKEVYDEHCSACHGIDGSGELLGSADFTDLRQMDNLAPRDLYLAVTQGRGSMPSWQARLSQDERWAVIDYLRSFTYEPALSEEVGVAQPTPVPVTEVAAAAACEEDQENPFAWDDSEAIQAGQALYLVQCAMCHGPDGSGGLPDTADFTSLEVSEELKAEPGTFFCSVTDGRGVMPAFGGSLAEEERWQVLTYMGSLGP